MSDTAILEVRTTRRQLAARKWIEDYKPRHIDFTGISWGEKSYRALAVLVLTERTSDFLADTDQQALKQAQLALSGKSWENYV